MSDGGRRGPPRPTPRGAVSATEVVALVLSVLWLAGAAAYFLLVPGGVEPMARTVFVMTLLAVFMPVALIWVAAAVARSARVMREESARLQTAVDAMRRAYLKEAKRTSRSDAYERRLTQIVTRTESAVAGLASQPEGAPPHRSIADWPDGEAGDGGQRSLALGEHGAPDALTKDDVIRALDFPEDENDAEGFEALRRALASPQLRRLVQESQKVLTALAEDGIYVDDLNPRTTLAADWRAFAGGRHGRAVERLGAIRDRSSLALAGGRMRSDPAFREEVLRFLRRFEDALTGFENGASDEDLARLAQTRTARAFMLLGRIAGLFD